MCPRFLGLNCRTNINVHLSDPVKPVTVWVTALVEGASDLPPAVYIIAQMPSFISVSLAASFTGCTALLTGIRRLPSHAPETDDGNLWRWVCDAPTKAAVREMSAINKNELNNNLSAGSCVCIGKRARGGSPSGR